MHPEQDKHDLNTKISSIYVSNEIERYHSLMTKINFIAWNMKPDEILFIWVPMMKIIVLMFEQYKAYFVKNGMEFSKQQG